jgi:hypothetical protein
MCFSKQTFEIPSSNIIMASQVLFKETVSLTYPQLWDPANINLHAPSASCMQNMLQSNCCASNTRSICSANKSMLAKDKEDSLITGSCSKWVQSKGPQFLEYQSSSMSHSANPSNMLLLLPKRLKFLPPPNMHLALQIAAGCRKTLNHPALELWSKNVKQ